MSLCALCALVVSALAAQSASAAGTTAYLCKEVAGGTGGFTDAHCKTGGSGKYAHVSIAANTSKNIAITNETTAGARSALILKATVAGLGLVVEAKRVSGFGTLENKEAGGEMYAEGSLPFGLTLEEVTANLNCGVSNPIGSVGKFEFEALRLTTKGQGDALKFEPVFSTKLAEFELFGASCPAALKGKYPLFGTFTGTPNGATTNFSHAAITTAKSLRLKNAETGPLAGLEGSLTISEDFLGPPIAFTT